MNKKKIALIILGLVVVAGVVFEFCITTFHIQYDDEIDQDLRSQMQRSSLTALNALRAEEYDVVLSFFDPETDSEKIKSRLSAARAEMGALIGSAKFRSFHDHYVTGLTGTATSNVVMSAHALSEKEGSYFVYPDANTDNVYVSLFTSEVSQRELLYIIIWGKYDDRWKIHSLDIANFGWSGKRGPDWLKEVKNVREKSGDIAAYLTIKAVSNLFRPSRMFAWKDLEDQTKALYAEILRSVAPRFSKPMVVQEIDSKPTIYGLDAMTITDLPGQVIPTIQYVSKYKHSQVDLVEEEANRMAPHLEKYLNGVSELGENLLFVAFEEPPTDPTKRYRTYRTVVKIK